MPGRKASDTNIARLEVIAEKHDRTAGHVLASMLRRHGEAGTAERLGIGRGSMNRLKMEAGVDYQDVCVRAGETIHIVHSDACRL